MIAAFQVFYGHAGQHLNLSLPSWPGSILGFFHGVPIFFMLSGFLIWNSVGRSRTYGHYLKKRFYRIYPELWLGVAVEAIVLIVFYGNNLNWISFGAFLFGQATIFQFWTPDSLRGYGCGTPNGSLWTIGVMIQFYIVVWILHNLLHRKNNDHRKGKPRGKVMWWCIIFVVSVLLSMVGHFATSIPGLMVKLYNQTFFPYLFLFLIGAFLAEYKDTLLGSLKKYWYLFVGIAIILYVFDIDIFFTTYEVIRSVFLICGLLGFAYRFPQLNIKTDITYGLYIYHMTVINAMISLDITGSDWHLFAALAVSVIFAFLSTKTIGKMAQRKKNLQME